MTVPRFDTFVVLAGMRTGSNFLEANLNAMAGIRCLGEVFNSVFVGYPDQESLLGMDRAARDAAPLDLLDRIRTVPDALCGFRFFHDHDPRVLEPIIQDQRCAKILLTRTPVESYVSWKIARETGQWKLTRVDNRKTVPVRFDKDEYREFHMATVEFLNDARTRLQKSGQTAFVLSYADLRSLDAVNGIARFLGVDCQLENLDRSLKVQNPGALEDKVENPADLRAALADEALETAAYAPVFEPARPASVPNYVATTEASLLYLPIKGGPDTSVRRWMAALDGCAETGLTTGMAQRDLQQWKKTHRNHRSFTVLWHPVVRAYHVFCVHVLPAAHNKAYARVRRLIETSGADGLPDDPGDVMGHRRAFLAFLSFVEANLAGQTALRVADIWCSQSHVLKGFGTLALPDRVLRDTELVDEFPRLAKSVGVTTPPSFEFRLMHAPVELADIYDAEVEKSVAKAYARDYRAFGFHSWK
ncbi:MAG: nodulation protein NodH [Pseudomonadota bacterium]